MATTTMIPAVACVSQSRQCYGNVRLINMRYPVKYIALQFLAAFIQPTAAHAQFVYQSGLPPYSCTAGGFNLGYQQNAYRLTGPIYAPLPGYTYTLSAIRFNTFMPNGDATLTLIAPPNTVHLPLPPLMVVPPLWIDYNFYSAVPIHKLTIYINNPVNRIDKKITCLVTGAAQ